MEMEKSKTRHNKVYITNNLSERSQMYIMSEKFQHKMSAACPNRRPNKKVKVSITLSFNCTSMFPAFFKGSTCWQDLPSGADRLIV